MHWRRATRPVPTAAAAVAGAVAGHTLAYALAVPGASARAALLAETGHGYWPAAVAVALVLGVAALVATVSSRFRLGLARVPAAGPRPGSLAARLALLQSGIYLVQELLERVASGMPPWSLLHDRALAIGLPLQLALAAVVAAVLLLAGCAAEAAGRVLARRSAPRGARGRSVWPAPRRPATPPARGVPGIRAPPPVAHPTP
jgi:hypothetical protein